MQTTLIVLPPVPPRQLAETWIQRRCGVSRIHAAVIADLAFPNCATEIAAPEAGKTTREWRQ